MSESDRELALKRINFGDFKFLLEFFKVLPGMPSLSEAARHLEISGAENLHHRLKRILRNLGNHPPINEGTKVTKAGRELEAIIQDLFKTAHPILSGEPKETPTAGKRKARRTVRLAMPEVMTNRSYTDLLRKLHRQPWADGLELVMRRASPSRLHEFSNFATTRTGERPYDLVMTLSQAPAGHHQKAKHRKGAPPSAIANLRRVLLVLNNDEIVEASTAGAWPDERRLQDRPIYFPPDSLWPGFPEQRLGRCDIHRVGSFAEAHSYALIGKGALAAAHPELLDEVEDQLCDTIPLGPDAGMTRLELRRRSDARDPLVDKVYALIAEHLEELGRDAAMAESVNGQLSHYSWVAYLSDAPEVDSTGTTRAVPKWRWKFASLSNFHVTALGHLKGRQQSLGLEEDAFNLTGRIMHGSGDWNHILWNSVDDRTEPGDREPRIEHYSVNIIFDDARLKRGLPLVGLWSGRVSRLDPWRPGCGTLVIATGPLDGDGLRSQLQLLRGNLQLEKNPLVQLNSLA